MWLWLFVALSSFIYIFSLTQDSFLAFWLCLEVAGLAIIAGFFSYAGNFNRLLGVLSYLILSGFSSCLVLGGGSEDLLNNFVQLGFLVKAGVYPFLWWVVAVFNSCTMSVFYVIGVVSKVVFLIIPSLEAWNTPSLLVVVTFLVLAILLWSCNFGIKSFLSYSSIGSSTLLFYICSNGGLSIGVSLFLIYSIVYALNFFVFYKLEGRKVSYSKGVIYFFLFIGVPFSLMFIYKIWSLICVLNISPVVTAFWASFSVLEQIYLAFYLIEKVGSGK